MACTNRIHLFARGLREEGHDCEIFISSPSNNKNNTDIQGIHQGVPFRYTAGRTQWPSNWFARRLVSFYGLFNFFRYAFFMDPKPDIIICYTWHLPSLFLTKIIARKNKSLLLSERTEIPFFHLAGRIKKHHAFHIKIALKLIDRLLLISEPLMVFFQKQGYSTKHTLLIPPMVDCDEFTPNEPDINNNKIFYCGDLSEEKDGLLSLINAFAQAREKNPKLKFLIAGQGYAKNRQLAFSLVERLGLKDSIHFLGYVSRSELRDYMLSANVLVLAKPPSHQAAFCFPSKLAEFLTTGNPVISSNVGEIGKILQDRVNAYLVSPNKPAQIAEAMLAATNNREEALAIGRCGRKTALSVFGYQKNIRRLLEFIGKKPNDK